MTGSAQDRLRDRFWLQRFRLRARLDSWFGVSRRLDAPVPHPERGRATRLPRRIWIYWEQGWSEAPPLVMACRKSWQDCNPDWELVSLDAHNVGDWLHPESLHSRRTMSRTHRSNLVRLNLLAREGGVWADATTYCSTPLTDWLPALMPGGFFAFSRPWRDRLLSSWFLAAEPQHPLVLGWLERVDRYWRLVERADFPFWVHRLFADACRTDRHFRRLWASTPRINAEEPHAVQFHALGSGDRERAMAALASPGVPVHKLNWRMPFPPPEEDSPLAMLLHGSEDSQPGGARPSATADGPDCSRARARP